MELVLNGGTYANLLPGQLSYRVVHFFYAKKSNRQLREAWGTTSPQLIKLINPEYTPKETAGNGNPAIIKYYDLQRNGWRCLKAENFYGYIVNYWEDRLPSDLYGRVRYVDDSFMAHDNDGVLLHLFSPLFLRRYYEERQGLNEDEPDAVPK